MNYSVFDIESDGLLENATKIHCMSITQYYNGTKTSFTLTDYDEMRAFLAKEEILIGHNIIRFDVPMLEKFLGITVTSRQIDTLSLSWYLYPGREDHNLENWGVDLGVPKPEIEDWSNLSIEEYIHRCKEDVKITIGVFDLELQYLMLLYDNDSTKVDRFINYLTFKMLCAREQEEVKWRLDVERCETSLQFFYKERDSKTDTLSKMMPKIITYRIASRPKILYKKDGSLSSHGEKWMAILKERNLPDYHVGAIKIPNGEEEPNPGSHAQLKAWLFSLGWTPITFKYVKQKDGSTKTIPQIASDARDGLCDSVKALFEKEPNLQVLDSLFVLRHRIGILEGFLKRKDENNFLKAEILGLTNTLRFQHTTIVNLPQIPKPYWEEVRGCLIAPDDNHVLCGSDMSGLEDNTKRHYMFYYDPEYVKEMMSPDFDAHLDIALIANMLTAEQVEEHKLYDKTKGKEGKSHKPVRLKAKKVNFSAVYGAGPPKIAITGGFTIPEAKIMHTAYWKRNWSVKKIANNCITKSINGQMWLFNPVSQFWYSLRSEKDKFSTLNQGTGVYCFDSWVRNVRKQGVKNCGQFHDEIISPILKGTEQEHESKLKLAIKQTNDELQLNVELRVSIDFGHRYSDIH